MHEIGSRASTRDESGLDEVRVSNFISISMLVDGMGFRAPPASDIIGSFYIYRIQRRVEEGG